MGIKSPIIKDPKAQVLSKLARDSPQEAKDQDKVAQLGAAVITNDIKKIKELSEEAEKSILNNMVFLACMSRTCKESTIATLFEAGAEKNAKDTVGRTYAHEAASYNNVDALKALKTAGSEIDSKDSKLNTPVFEAASFGHFETFVELYREDDSKRKNRFGATLMSIAKKHNYKKIVDFLREKEKE